MTTTKFVFDLRKCKKNVARLLAEIELINKTEPATDNPHAAWLTKYPEHEAIFNELHNARIDLRYAEFERR